MGAQYSLHSWKQYLWDSDTGGRTMGRTYYDTSQYRWYRGCEISELNSDYQQHYQQKQDDILDYGISKIWWDGIVTSGNLYTQ